MDPNYSIIQGSHGGWGRGGCGKGLFRLRGWKKMKGEAALEVSLAAWVGLKWVINRESKLPKKSGTEMSDMGSGTEFQDTCFI